ncbi:DUF1642 domain-containing protein [Enterococcus faecium]|uniref:DUF1642 domain-containing protein n=1 Tax=Enterococcus faecium TaxID=1352 RepID=UPI00177ACCA8|nr:DUF1642 domain-containing protein [Enterococcus faecium]MBD9743584.1 DUF1642 domain-containing protein [Enterococcus faecium]MBD9755876.1 DUF1642 domain-containing protein [Enterococcus faecium]MDW3723889.1 DUF1642 domain-containing protein [Enterococcus faecium]
MNKKVLIDKWESKTGAPSYVISDFPINPSKNDMYTFGYGVARKEILEDLKQLDEPQKPVVPKFVADWFEENKDDLDNAIFGYLVFWEERDTDSVLYQWFAKSENNPIENLIRMKDGYEVEKEPLYQVKLKFGRQYLSKNADGNKFDFYSCIAFPPSFSKKELESIGNGVFYKIDGDKEWINPIIELVPVEQEEAE